MIEPIRNLRVVSPAMEKLMRGLKDCHCVSSVDVSHYALASSRGEIMAHINQNLREQLTRLVATQQLSQKTGEYSTTFYIDCYVLDGDTVAGLIEYGRQLERNALPLIGGLGG